MSSPMPFGELPGRVTMSVLDDVVGSLRSMTQVQLLLAFMACIGYAFAQGSLLSVRGQRAAWLAATLSAAGFAFVSENWTHATMLLGFAVAGMGSFVAGVWLTSRALGFDRPPTRTDVDVDAEENTFGTAPPLPGSARSAGHAHSL